MTQRTNLTTHNQLLGVIFIVGIVVTIAAVDMRRRQLENRAAVAVTLTAEMLLAHEFRFDPILELLGSKRWKNDEKRTTNDPTFKTLLGPQFHLVYAFEAWPNKR